MVPGPGSYDVITSKSALPTCKFAKSERNTFLGNHNPSPMEYKISEPLV